MANMCELELTLRFANEADAKTFEGKLQPVLKKAAQERSAVLFGKCERGFFDNLFERDGSTIRMYGDVKWALDYSEAMVWTQYFCSLAPLESMTIYYFEPGCQVLGQYEYSNGNLTDTYVPDEFFPEYNEEQEEYIPDTYEAIEEHGIDVFVGEIAA